MRLYAASDLHGKCRYGETIKDGIRRSRADAVVLAGDILNYRRNPDLLRFLDDLPVPVFLVRGNSDPASLEGWAAQSRNVRSLHLNPVVLDGVGLVGLSGTLPLPFHSRVGWHEPRMLRRLQRVSEDKYVDDTLITHAEYQLFLDETMTSEDVKA